MMIRAIGYIETPQNNIYQQDKQKQTRYYTPQESKEKVKSDFKKYLDKEIEKLKVDIII